MSEKQDLNLGQIIHGNPERDAIHVAVAPVIAACELKPGQHIGLLDGEASPGAKKLIGIVDPYLKSNVRRHQKFWMFLYPNTIIGMRHHWKHPDFTYEENSKERAEVRIRQIAQELDVDYEDLISHAQSYLEYGDYWCEGGRFDGVYLPDDFWDSYEILFDVKVPQNEKYSFFSCSC